jgi:hypothetical protein
MCERHDCDALFAHSMVDAYSVLAEQFNRISLIVLDLTTNPSDAFALRQLQLDAPRVAAIPTMVITEQPLTPGERTALRPSSVGMKPLPFDDAVPLSAR